MPQNAKKCKEIQTNANKSKRFDSTKRFGSGSGFFEAPVQYVTVIHSYRFCTNGWPIPFAKRRKTSMFMFFRIPNRRNWASKPLSFVSSLLSSLFNCLLHDFE